MASGAPDAGAEDSREAYPMVHNQKEWDELYNGPLKRLAHYTERQARTATLPTVSGPQLMFAVGVLPITDICREKGSKREPPLYPYLREGKHSKGPLLAPVRNETDQRQLDLAAKSFKNMPRIRTRFTVDTLGDACQAVNQITMTDNDFYDTDSDEDFKKLQAVLRKDTHKQQNEALLDCQSAVHKVAFGVLANTICRIVDDSEVADNAHAKRVHKRSLMKCELLKEALRSYELGRRLINDPLGGRDLRAVD